jgi:hypothetical protein
MPLAAREKALSYNEPCGSAARAVSDDLLPFNLVPRKRPRHDGWTEACQRALTAALADNGSVSAAARVVGLSHSSAYELYNHPEGASLNRCGAAWLRNSLRTTSKPPLE